MCNLETVEFYSGVSIQGAIRPDRRGVLFTMRADLSGRVAGASPQELVNTVADGHSLLMRAPAEGTGGKDPQYLLITPRIIVLDKEEATAAPQIKQTSQTVPQAFDGQAKQGFDFFIGFAR